MGNCLPARGTSEPHHVPEDANTTKQTPSTPAVATSTTSPSNDPIPQAPAPFVTSATDEAPATAPPPSSAALPRSNLPVAPSAPDFAQSPKATLDITTPPASLVPVPPLSPRATASPNSTKHATKSELWTTTTPLRNEPRYTVFISHAAEDKLTIALPLREKLKALGITAFVYEVDLRIGTDVSNAIIEAMETARVAVVVLSPEFIARKWTMKELMCFLTRRENCIANGQEAPVIIPFFYRLSVAELRHEPRFDRRSEDGESLYRKSRFFERQQNGEPEADIAKIQVALRTLQGIAGVRNDIYASKDSSHVMYSRRELVLQDLIDRVAQLLPMNRRLEAESIKDVDRFRQFFPPLKSSVPAVLDFSSTDEGGNPITAEGRVKQHLFEQTVPSLSPQATASPNPAKYAMSSGPWTTTTPPSNEPKYTVFISYAGEDKATIAIPLREKLRALGITAFVDEADMPPGTDALKAMIEAMETARVAVVVLSPEFIARKWTMKELMCFLTRRENCIANGQEAPVIIPFFYRLSVAELRHEPRFDRRSEDGESLYRKSRFFERQQNGEPEADIAKIQVALRTLQGIAGVRNSIYASKDSSHVMYSRRDVLQDLCNGVAKNVPANLGQLLKQTTVSPRVVSICGVGGVGKSTVLRSLCWEDEVRQHFSDGVHIIKLGKDASTGTLFQQIRRVLRDSGAEEAYSSLSDQNDVHAALRLFESWFDGKRCAFLIDDVWPDGVPLSLLSRFLKIGSGLSGNGVLFTTREREIAKLAPSEKSVRLEPRESRGRIARRILFLHADQQETDHRSTLVEDSIRRILDICSGLPVALAVAGRNVMKLSSKLPRPGNDEEAWKRYLTQLENCQRNLFATSISNLDKQRREDTLGYASVLSFEEMYRRLCVLQNAKPVPRSMLKHLWQTTDEHADMILETFVEWDLASRKVRRAGEEYMWHLSLHDLLHEFAVEEAERNDDTKEAHECLLNGYKLSVENSSELGRTSTWWSPELRPDGYIHGNLCRHLVGAGRTTELVELLMSPQWAMRQLEVNDIQSLQADFSLGIRALRDRRTRKTEEDRQ